jgi:HIV Tat-specific factor 1
VDETQCASSQLKKRKVYTSNETSEEGLSKKAKVAVKKIKDPPQNRAVYVTNLPSDTNEIEIQEVFSKCGVIAEQIDGGKPRIKLYRNDDNSFKGDALVVYFRPESVPLAVQMLDNTNLRSGPAVQGSMRVQAADFSYKVQKDPSTITNTKEKRKVIKRMQKLNK